MGFPRQEYWSGVSFPSPGDLPHPGIKPRSPALQVDSLPLSHQGSQRLHSLSLIAFSYFLPEFHSGIICLWYSLEEIIRCVLVFGSPDVDSFPLK